MTSTVILLLASGATSGSQGEPQVDVTRASLEKWVETRRVISKERRDWALGKEVLQDRIEIVSDEISTLGARIDEAAEDIAEADKRRAEMLLENEAMKAASASLEEAITELETRTKALLVRLPEPLRERVRPLSQQLPPDPEQTKLSLSIRYQNVIGLLNQVNKFNLEVTHNSERHQLLDGTTAEVTAMYLGLGQSYYANSDGTYAGVGRPGDAGWEWTPITEAAPEVLRGISILRDEAQPDFVRLPIRVKSTSSPTR